MIKSLQGITENVVVEEDFEGSDQEDSSSQPDKIINPSLD